MVEKKLDELSNLITVELSLVNKGANEKKRFPVFKAKESSMETQEVLKAVLETKVDREDELAEVITKAGVSEGASTAVLGALRLLSAYKEELPADVLKSLQEVAGMPPVEITKGENMSEYKYPEATDAEGVEKWVEGIPAEVLSKIQKSADKPVEKKLELPPEAQAIFKAQQDELEKVRKDLKAEKDLREIAEWTTKAKAHLSHFPGKSVEEMGTMLKALHDANPELANEQFESMKAASAAIKEGLVLKSAGSVGLTAGATAMDKIEKLAEGLVQKSEKPLTKQQAITKVLDQNPELYAQYIEEVEG